MCGEYPCKTVQTFYNSGSPPHVWRILVLQEQSYTRLRITSTCVENTTSIELIEKEIQDHLHMCGEYQLLS